MSRHGYSSDGIPIYHDPARHEYDLASRIFEVLYEDDSLDRFGKVRAVCREIDRECQCERRALLSEEGIRRVEVARGLLEALAEDAIRGLYDLEKDTEAAYHTLGFLAEGSWQPPTVPASTD